MTFYTTLKLSDTDITKLFIRSGMQESVSPLMEQLQIILVLNGVSHIVEKFRFIQFYLERGFDTIVLR